LAETGPRRLVKNWMNVDAAEMAVSQASKSTAEVQTPAFEISIRRPGSTKSKSPAS
jgi:hypothetical protein